MTDKPVSADGLARPVAWIHPSSLAALKDGSVVNVSSDQRRHDDVPLYATPPQPPAGYGEALLKLLTNLAEESGALFPLEKAELHLPKFLALYGYRVPTTEKATELLDAIWSLIEPHYAAAPQVGPPPSAVPEREALLREALNALTNVVTAICNARKSSIGYYEVHTPQISVEFLAALQSTRDALAAALAAATLEGGQGR